MRRIVKAGDTRTVRLAGSYFIATCATLAAILMFVGIGSQVVPAAFAGVPAPPAIETLKIAFLLNIAIILLGWGRAKDLRQAIDAWEAAERAAHLNANIDHATGLANRREFIRCLEEAIDRGTPGAVLIIDLDHFKRVNDLHGHAAGDDLLKQAAAIFTRSAPADACCARIGGDEFTILLPDTDVSGAEAVATRLLAAFIEPVQIERATLRVTASIGIAAFAGPSEQSIVLRQSDVALYAAKKAGRNCFAWFNEKLGMELAEQLALDEDIRVGIERGEFVPFFQPLIDLKTRQLTGFEALARWRSPSRGLVEPDSFIAHSERTGLIAPLTMAVMKQALMEAKTWPAHLKLAVNISPVQFRDPALAQEIVRLITSTGFPARRLELEITETALLEDRERALATINSLKALGISISLDDFGTGYASLAQLDSLPVDRIKIDRSFISRFVKSDRTAAIVDAIAALGHKLKVPLTAEGVESEQMRMDLVPLGCTEAQGWLYGRAVSAETVHTFLQMGVEPSAAVVPGQPGHVLQRRPGAKF
jgi:diguanylate cyclase (GGDEF)-like protein